MSRVMTALALTVLLSGIASAAASKPATDATAVITALVGRPAPRIEGRLHIGASVPSGDALKGKVVLLFFWAHWCVECKAESPIVARLLDRYRSQGLVVIAPTERYGFAEGGRPAPPDKELRHIISVRDAYYGFLRNESVPIGEANHRAYGVDSVPTLVLIDRQGVVRLDHAGTMTEAELEDAIRPLSE